MPRLSIGLPVYNGENFLRQAIDSILAQTFTDLELIIADNASTDATRVICEQYAAADERVRYVRHERNIGAGPNFNFLLDQCDAEYFKWAAHDDLLAPTFLDKCIGFLDEHAAYVLATARARVIDERGRFIEDYEYRLDTDAKSVSQRFRRQIRGHQCYEVFGVIRSSALRGTPGMGNHFAGDAALLLRLVQKGRFHVHPERLFFSRNHSQQSKRLRRSVKSYMVWFDPRYGGRRTLPYWYLWSEYLAIAMNRDLTFTESCLCNVYVAHWALKRWRFLLRDLMTAGARSRMIPDSVNE